MQSRQQALRDYCLKIYNVPAWLECLSSACSCIPQTNVEETYFCLSVWANNRLRFKKSFWNQAQKTKRRKSRMTRVKMFPSTNFNSICVILGIMAFHSSIKGILAYKHCYVNSYTTIKSNSRAFEHTNVIV